MANVSWNLCTKYDDCNMYSNGMFCIFILYVIIWRGTFFLFNILLNLQIVIMNYFTLLEWCYAKLCTRCQFTISHTLKYLNFIYGDRNSRDADSSKIALFRCRCCRNASSWNYDSFVCVHDWLWALYIFPRNSFFPPNDLINNTLSKRTKWLVLQFLFTCVFGGIGNIQCSRHKKTIQWNSMVWA